jgi:hypothetical protein
MLRVVMRRNQFRALAAVAALLAVALVAMPALGVDPSGSPSAVPSTEPSTTASTEPSTVASTEPSATASAAPSAAPSASPAAPAPAPAASAGASEPDEDGQGGNNGSKPDKAATKDKGSEAPEHPVTLTGIVGHPSGQDDFTLVVGIKVYRLSDGPPWWWGDAAPLAAFVGKTVTIDGEQEEGSDEVDVLAINGKAIREPGRPPWAGGWKVVGSKHPGWAQWKVDKLAGKGHGRDTAPGQQNQPSPAP